MGTRLSELLLISCKTTAVFLVARLRSSLATLSRQALVAFPRQVLSPMRQKYLSRTRATLSREFFSDLHTAMISRMLGTLFWHGLGQHSIYCPDGFLENLFVIEGIDQTCPKSFFGFL